MLCPDVWVIDTSSIEMRLRIKVQVLCVQTVSEYGVPEHGVPEVCFQEIIKCTEVSKEPAVFVFILQEFFIQLP